MQGIDPTPLEQSYPEASAGVTSTIIALHRIWINKILGYARKHGLPVLSLESEDLASLYSIGFAENRGSSNLAGGTQFNLKDTYIPQAILDSIISEKYVPLLTQAVPQLEKEVERINSLRSDKKRVLFEKQHERARLEMMKLKDPSISLVQRILEFPVK